MYLIILNNKTQFAISVGDSEPRNFFHELLGRGHKRQATGSKQQATGIKRQATGSKLPNLPLVVGGWAHRLQARESRTPGKVSRIVERGS